MENKKQSIFEIVKNSIRYKELTALVCDREKD
jgi:hypothetical protein